MTLTYNDQIRRENDSEIIANLLRKDWIENEPPSYDAATQHEPVFVDGAWVVTDKTAEEIAAESVKRWPSKAEFWAEFTDTEKAAILTSDDIDVKMLDKELTMWSGVIIATDSRVVAGLDKLTQLNIITESRRTEILAN